MKNESLSKTLLVALAVIFLCSLMVSGAITLLRPIQLEQRAPQNLLYILQTAGLVDFSKTQLKQVEVFEQFKKVEIRILDLNKSSLVNKTEKKDYYYRQSMSDPSACTKLIKKDDLAQLEQRPHKIPTYWIHSAISKTKLVVPIYGKGMWSMIHGYIALEKDFNTISGIYFYEQGDTPGIGELIQDPKWLASWQGKQLYNVEGILTLSVNTNDSLSSTHQVDGITGATKTVIGVNNLIQFWFGNHGYRKFLLKQRQLLGG